MKSIGILTIHNSLFNYGGTLQGYALYRYLSSEGCDVEIINLLRPCHHGFVHSYRFPILRQPKNYKFIIRGFVKELLGIKRWSKEGAPKLVGTAEGRKKFEDFNRQIKMSQPYNFIPDLYKNPPKYDVYISGSDQLWNPTQYYSLEPFFLTFVKSRSARKISYGTSIGLSEIYDDEKKLFAKWLSSYDHISVREEQAQKILRPLVSQEVLRVPDPTFLLEPNEWIKLAGNEEKTDDYILVFSLGRREFLYNKARELAKQFGCRVKIIDHTYKGKAYEATDVIMDTGPLDFINLIKNARLVLTDSFHCTVFSLITGTRNFYSYLSRDDDRGSRVVDLLALYGLSNRIIHDVDEIPDIDELRTVEIDHEKVNCIIDQQREIGRQFLHMAID